MAGARRLTHEVVVEAVTDRMAMNLVLKRWYRIHGAPARSYVCAPSRGAAPTRCRGRIGPFTRTEAEHVATELCPALEEQAASRCSCRVVAKKR